MRRRLLFFRTISITRLPSRLKILTSLGTIPIKSLLFGIESSVINRFVAIPPNKSAILLRDGSNLFANIRK